MDGRDKPGQDGGSVSVPLLCRRSRRACARGDDVVHRGLHAALLMRHAGKRKPHFGRRQRAHQITVVDAAEVADAEIFRRIAAEAGAVGNIERIERKIAERVAVMPLGIITAVTVGE